MNSRNKTLLSIALLLATSLTANAQVVRQIGGASADTAMIAELQAQVGLVEGGEVLEVVDAMPSANRPEPYREIDLDAGDRLLAINGKLLRSISDFQTAYDAVATGDEVELGVQRGEQRWIARFAKADPAALPTVRRLEIQGSPDDVAMLMGLGVILVRQDGELQVNTLFPGATGASHFQVGDVFVSVNGEEGLEPTQLQDLWQSLEVGADVEFEMRRGDESLAFSVKKEEMHGGARVIRQ